MIFVTRVPVQFQRGIVRVVGFEMDGIHAHLACPFGYELHGVVAEAPPPVFRLDIPLIDEGFAAACASCQERRFVRGRGFAKNRL